MKVKTRLPLGFCFPEQGNPNVGSQRIYTNQVSDALQNLGLRAESHDEARVVYVGRGRLRRYLAGGFLGRGQILVAMNPSTEINWLTQRQRGQISYIVAGSFEERSSLSHLGIKTFILPQIENWIPKKPKGLNSHNGALTLLYHGNKEHILEMRTEIRKAMATFGQKRSLRLLLLYNIEGLGKARLHIPNVEVEHRQWSQSQLIQALSESHVGIVPTLTRASLSPRGPKNRLLTLLRIRDLRELSLTTKRTSNAGRILIFVQAGIPVISEPSPSSASVIPSPAFGELALTEEDWLEAIERFSDPAEREATSAASNALLADLGLDFEKMLREIHLRLVL